MTVLKNAAFAMTGLALAAGSSANAAPVRAASSLPSATAAGTVFSTVKRSGARLTQADEARGKGGLAKGSLFVYFAAAAAVAVIVIIVASNGTSRG